MCSREERTLAEERKTGEDRQKIREKLEQYTDVQSEQKDVLMRIQKLRSDIQNMEEISPEIADSVTCGKKGGRALQIIRVSGFPEQEYQTKKEKLKKLMIKMELINNQLLELLTEVEEYVETVKDSRMRRILRYRYMDNMPWKKIARILGGKSTADSIRMEHNRFFETK